MTKSFRSPLVLLLLAALAPSTFVAQAQETEDAEESEGHGRWDTTAARGLTREIDFTTSEGTWMSLDVSPDGAWIVFDLLANAYRLPIAGGVAECLTCDAGVAINYHPRYSPDGEHIAFVSDRGGQNNLWVMGADGSDPTAVFDSEGARVVEPAWTADGEYIVVRRQALNRPGQTGGSGVYLYHWQGGTGVELLGGDARASWPEPSSDGRWLYYQATAGQAGASGHRNIFAGAYQLRRLDLQSGDVLNVTAGTSGQQVRSSSGGAFAPAVSPDGRWLAFARRVEGTMSYKGHRFGPRTALWLRDLHSGAEHKLMDPIEQDMTEGMKVLRVLPGYSWTPDSRSIVLSQGGKLRHLHLDPDLTGAGGEGSIDGVTADGGTVTTIPFTARVQRTISEMARASFRIEDGDFRARFLRWYAPSPDGARLAFQAVGRIWTQALPDGSPARLTPDGFGPYEFAPAWSPDGAWIAFTSWDDEGRGHLWKVASTGGDPVRLSAEPGEFLNPAWSPDGTEIVVARGSGATARGRTFAANAWFELVRYSADGTELGHVAFAPAPGGRRHVARPGWTADGRIFFIDRGASGGGRPRNQLVSVLPDGSDRREHLSLPFADDMVPSPDGRRVAFQEGDNVFVTPLPMAGTAGNTVDLEKARGRLPVTTLSTTGGLYPSWIDDDTVAYGSGPTFTVHDLATETSAEHDIDLRVPRAVPTGTVAFTGARIVTLEDRQVIESGDLVIAAGRIACVGDCDTSAADEVIDATGKTIIPGFVDMHAHHYREHSGVLPRRNFEQGIYLAYGVTTNLDNSMWSQSVFPAAELIEAGGMVGPRTYSTGDPLYRGDGARQNEIRSYEVADDNIMRLKSWGAVAIKQYLQPNRDQRQWVSDVARREGLMVTSEGSDLAYNMSMIMDGQTAWEHPMSYMPIYGDAAKFFGHAGAVYSPTFIVGGPAAWNEEFFFADTDLWMDDKQRRWLPWRQLLPHTRRRMLRPPTDYSYPLVAQAMADVIAEGGGGAIGSHGQQHGIGSHWETWMVASAMGPHGALEVASLHGARFLGAEQDIGSIRVGKLGDVLVLDSNPLDDIRNTLDLRYVVKAGVVHDATTLDEVWPRQRAYGAPHWYEPGIWMDDDRPTDTWDRR